MNYDWVNGYIGLPYQVNGRGPHAYDCYGLVQAVLRDQRNVFLPDYADLNDDTAQTVAIAITRGLASQLRHSNVAHVSEPDDYDIAVFKGTRLAFHVGLYIAGGLLHVSHQTVRSVHERIEQMTRAGRGTPEWYRWVA